MPYQFVSLMCKFYVNCKCRCLLVTAENLLLFELCLRLTGDSPRFSLTSGLCLQEHLEEADLVEVEWFIAVPLFSLSRVQVR